MYYFLLFCLRILVFPLWIDKKFIICDPENPLTPNFESNRTIVTKLVPPLGAAILCFSLKMHNVLSPELWTPAKFQVDLTNRSGSKFTLNIFVLVGLSDTWNIILSCRDFVSKHLFIPPSGPSRVFYWSEVFSYRIFLVAIDE